MTEPMRIELEQRLYNAAHSGDFANIDWTAVAREALAYANEAAAEMRERCAQIADMKVDEYKRHAANIRANEDIKLDPAVADGAWRCSEGIAHATRALPLRSQT